MLNLKKCLSVTVALVMVFTLAMSVTFADEEISITYWNADSTKIMIDLSHDVAESDFRNAVTVKKNGEPVSVTVEKKEKTTTGTLDDADVTTTNPTLGKLTANSDYNYIIKPTGGIEFGAIYNITIASGLTDGTVSLASNWSKSLAVTKIWKEDFENTDYGTTSPWKVTSGTVGYEVQGDSKALKVTFSSAAGAAMVRPDIDENTVEFGDTGKTAKTLFARNSGTYFSLKDYNIEAKVMPGSVSSTYYTGFVEQDRITAGGLKYTGAVGAGIGYASAASGKKLGVIASHLTTYNSDEYERQANAKPSSYTYSRFGQSIESNPFVSGFNDMSLSVIGSDIKFYAGTAFVDYKYTVNEITNCGTPGLITYAAGASNIYYFDDIIVTQAAEVNMTSDTAAVTYWNADSSKIMLDVNKNIDADAFASAITLTKNGAPVPFTIEKRTNSSSDTLAAGSVTESLTALEVNNDTAYLIYPSGGIDFDGIYTITVADYIADAANATAYTISGGYEKTFKVNKIWKETFDDYTDFESAPWTFAGNAPNVTATIEPDSTASGKELKIAYSALAKYTLIPDIESEEIFADTNTPANALYASNTKYITLTDYNIELSAKAYIVNQNYTHGIYLEMLNATEGSYTNRNYLDGFKMGIGCEVSNSRVLVAGATLHNKTTHTSVLQTNGLPQSGDQMNNIRGASLSDTYYYTKDAITEMPISMSVKDNNMRVITQKGGYGSFNYSLDIPNYGLPAIMPTSQGNGQERTYYLDDIIITKAVEITGSDLDISEIKIKDSLGGEIFALSGQTTVDAAVSVLNPTATAKSGKVIVAVYDDTMQVLKNVAVSDTQTFAQGTNTVSLTNIAANGGTKVKVFVWNDMNNITPFAASAAWN